MPFYHKKTCEGAQTAKMLPDSNEDKVPNMSSLTKPQLFTEGEG